MTSSMSWGWWRDNFPLGLDAARGLRQSQTELDRDAGLDRYDFLSALAAAESAVLSWPSATAERSVAYPSRWLIEAANRLHEQSRGIRPLDLRQYPCRRRGTTWFTYIRSRRSRPERLGDFDRRTCRHRRLQPDAPRAIV